MEEKKFFDFSSGEDFDLNAEYATLFNGEEFKMVNPNESKLKDADDIIKDLGGLYMEALSLENYEKSFINFNEFLDKFNVENDIVKNMTKTDRDKLFGYGKELFMNYQTKYGELCFNFELSLKEWNYIEHTLTKKLSYNGQEMFNYWELYTKFIKPTKEIASKLPKQIESFVPVCSIQSLILTSHLLMKHEEKGSTDSFMYFKNVLTEIAKMTKLFNAYGVILERMTKQFDNWVTVLNVMDEFYDRKIEDIIDIEPEPEQ